jgi:hypothetical protein
MLVAQIESGEHADEHAVIEPELVIRKSAGPCKS